MREIREFFLNDGGTRYQLHAEMREAGFIFNLTVRNEFGSLFANGEAQERDGDLESIDDGDGETHLAVVYRFRSTDCRLTFAMSIEEGRYIWITSSTSKDEDEQQGLVFQNELPLERVYG
jgi:hypothetical protein